MIFNFGYYLAAEHRTINITLKLFTVGVLNQLFSEMLLLPTVFLRAKITLVLFIYYLKTSFCLFVTAHIVLNRSESIKI